jgi:hypothetical protein
LHRRQRPGYDGSSSRTKQIVRDRVVRSIVTTILILDDDLGFALWLGQSLSAARCRVLPATSVSEAGTLISHFGLTVDLVILNPSVAGGADFTRTLRREQGYLRVATLDPPVPGDHAQPGFLGPVLAPQR